MRSSRKERNKTMSNSNETTYTIELTLDEISAVSKSLSIGCDQLMKKIVRLNGSKRATDVSEEYLLLMSARVALDEVLVGAVNG